MSCTVLVHIHQNRVAKDRKAAIPSAKGQEREESYVKGKEGKEQRETSSWIQQQKGGRKGGEGGERERESERERERTEGLKKDGRKRTREQTAYPK